MRYPVYIPSLGRADNALTPRLLADEEIPFHLVVEPQERETYAAEWGDDRLLVLPYSGRGLFASREWIRLHANSSGFWYHWQLDDNIRRFARYENRKAVTCPARLALEAAERVVDQFENVGAAALRHSTFAWTGFERPYAVNQQVYCCMLLRNHLPFCWRARGWEDADMSLQILSGGWCTILFNAFMMEKVGSVKRMKGGQTGDGSLYKDDGRLRAARELERLWPALAGSTCRRWGRPGKDLSRVWRRFTTPLKMVGGG